MPGMNLFNRKRFHYSLRTRLVATFGLLLVVVLGSFLIFTNMLVIQPLKQRTLDDMVLENARISDRFDDYIAVQNQLSQRMLANRSIFAFGELQRQPSQGVTALNQNRVLSSVMFQAVGPSQNIRDIILYDLRGEEVTSYIGYAEPQPLTPLLQDGHAVGRLRDSAYVLYAEPGQPTAFVRSIIDMNGTVYGYMAIQMGDDELRRLADAGNAGAVYVIDGRGNLVASSPNADYESHAASLRSTGELQGIYTGHGDHYIAYHTSASTGWTVYTVVPRDAVLGSVGSVAQIAVILIISLTLFSYLYIHFTSKSLVLPIRKLRSQILNISYSNLSLRMDGRQYNNEFQLFNEAFRELLERLQISIEREKAALREEVAARNSALQAQIAPHFIHNVLYLISIAAQEHNIEAATAMCKHLSESLRYIVSSPYQHVTLQDEIDHTVHYLSLIQHKYEDDLEWTIEADPEAASILLPRLVLQPFVENCIEHAFDRTDPPWRIAIKVKLYRGLWAIEISDNGQGFDEGVIESLLQRIRGEVEQETKIGSMGIANTVNRLELMYPNRLFFNLFNNPEGGATVQIIASLTRDFY